MLLSKTVQKPQKDTPAEQGLSIAMVSESALVGGKYG